MDRDVAGGEPAQGALEEGDDCGAALVGEQLAIGQPRMVVDDGVEVVVAERVGALKPGPASIARDRVTWPPKARIALDVHVEQVARTRPLVADHLRARLARRPRASVTAQNRVHRRMRDAELAGDPPRPPTGALARRAHPRFDRGRRACR
jgi:hypothetical protein